ncbi:hypothetical protein [Cytobacillus sp. AMY 15.2]|uniref:hypothetical protein n=1 Tax=Cytobacillus sp. AMY 15.2 TaxID=2939563 RepID=UPI00203F11D2|nr:hypothetical protein [Cytobacillus sp. AMY 15.2]
MTIPRRIKKRLALLAKRFKYDSDWVRTSDLYPVKVANSHGSNKVIMEYPLHIKASEGVKFVPLGLKWTIVDGFRQQFVNIYYITCDHFDFLFN